MPNQDISRWMLQTRKHYAAVRLQQGRVLLDSDVNDSDNLGAEQRRRVLVDVFGPKGSRDQGFTLRRPLDGSGAEPPLLQAGDEIQSQQVTFDDGSEVDVLPLAIGSGSVNLGGMRFEMDDAENVVFQRDFLQLTSPSDVMPAFAPAFRQLFYLRAWEQGVSSVEDEEVGEAMLRGPDSSFRLRRMRRVEAFTVGSDVTTCNQAWAALRAGRLEDGNATFDERNNELVSQARLQLVFAGGEAADACAPMDPFGKRYLGAENQTLRVMLTSAGSYVWALDNGAPLFKVRLDGLADPAANGVKATILNPPRDERHMPFQNRVVEIVPFSALLDGGDVPDADPQFRKVADEVGVFTRVTGPYDPVAHTFALELSPAITDALQGLVHTWDPAHPFATDLNVSTGGRDERFFYMRLWHVAPTADLVEIPVSTDPAGPTLGDTGIVPVFPHEGEPGDFWVATLRVDLPDRIQPYEFLRVGGVAPTGPRRFFAPLALVAGEAVDGAPDFTRIIDIQDCRPLIRPLSDRGCTTIIVGDGVHTFGDVTTIQDALAALPDEGGVISVRPGVYQGPITINGHDITLEGCGDATVIANAPFPSPNGLLFISGGTNVRVSGFKVQAADERALLVGLGSRGIDIASMHFVSGTITNGVFTPQGNPIFAQVEISANSADVTVRDSVLEPNRQPGLRVASASRVTLSGLNVVGSQSLEENNTAPLVWLDAGAVDVAVRDCVLDARGQQGVHVSDGALRIELVGLAIAVHAQDGSVGGAPVQTVAFARPGLNVDAGSSEVQLAMRRSRVVVDATSTEHAAVVLGGTSITLEENHIEALSDATTGRPLAWGGVQVRSNAVRVRIAGNRIVGGYGHGITLASALWVQVNEFQNQLSGFNAAGAGAGQTDGGRVTGHLESILLNDVQYQPALVEPVTEVVISDNRIEGMSTNGISTLTVLGLFDGTLPEAVDLRIERNVITGNVLDPFPNVFTFQPLPLSASTILTRIEMPELSLGGIVLAAAADAQIRDNEISGNGTSDVLPVNGIFILCGDAIDVAGNRILDNGARAPADSATVVRSGPRAGIAVMLAGAAESNLGRLEGVLAGSVALDAAGFSLRVTNNTVRQPEGRALEVIATGPVHVHGNFFSAHGNAGGDAPSEQLQVGDLIYVQNLGGPWERLDLTPDDGRLAGFKRVDLTLETLLVMHPTVSPYHYVGVGGAVHFSNNHTILDWNVDRPPTQADAPLAFFPVALLTLDHLEVLGNHLALRIDNVPAGLPPPLGGVSELSEPVLAHLLALGVTVKIELNRFSENLRSVLLSLMARAEIMNSTAFNQTTHDIFSIRQVRSQQPPGITSNSIQVVNNQVMFLRTPGLASASLEALRDNLQSLFGLAFPIA